MSARLAAAALCAALLAGPGPARAGPTPLEASVAVSQGRLSVTLDLSPAFGPEQERRLGNGLTNVVAVVVAVVPEQGGEPVSVTGRVVEVLFDVWDEAYVVVVRDARLPRPVRRSAPDFAALRRLLSEARELDLGPVALLPPGRFRIEVSVEVNPVSRELMQRTRELLAKPTTGRPGAGSRSVLGSMAGYFLRDPTPGADALLLRSRAFGRDEVAAP